MKKLTDRYDKVDAASVAYIDASGESWGDCTHAEGATAQGFLSYVAMVAAGWVRVTGATATATKKDGFGLSKIAFHVPRAGITAAQRARIVAILRDAAFDGTLMIEGYGTAFSTVQYRGPIDLDRAIRETCGITDYSDLRGI